MSLSTCEYLQHILDETNYIMMNSMEVSKDAFIEDETLKRAYVRSIEIIGEAVKQLPDELRQKYTTIKWRSLAGMRDRLIHNYFGVDYDLVWDVIVNKIPELDSVVKQILAQDYQAQRQSRSGNALPESGQ